MPLTSPGAEAARVLIVEDDDPVAEAVARGLRIAGYTSSRQPDGEGALPAIKTGAFDAVILDVGLPGLDGLEVCRRVRTTGNHIRC